MRRLHILRSRWLLILAALLLLGFVAATPARAADARGGNQVVIGREEVINDDLYVAGNTVTIDGAVKGDLVAVASQITINGKVEGDVLAAGQGIVINGQVGDDVRAAGQAILIGPGARIAGDLAVAGMSLENQAGSNVEGDALVGAYQALLSGTIGKNVRGGMSRLELRGAIGGDVDVAVNGEEGAFSAVQFSPAAQTPIPAVQPNLVVADSARIGGKLIYQSTTAATISPAAQVAGGATFNQLPPTQAATPGRLPWLSYLQRLAGLLLVGLLLLWLMPAWTRRMADSVEAKPLPTLGWGLVAFATFIAAVLGVLIVTIILAITFGYLTLGGLVAMIISLGMLANAALVIGYIGFVGYVAEIIIGYMAGRRLLQRTQPAWVEKPMAPLALGVILYVILSAIPVLGTLVGLLVAVLGLGALWQWGRATFVRARARPTAIRQLQPHAFPAGRQSRRG
jgi:cytoskeletal protein CcmA (bactofilin family)